MKTEKYIRYSEITVFHFSAKRKKKILWKYRRQKGKQQQNFLENSKVFLSDKIVSKKRIILIKNDKIISEDSDVSQSLNSFFTSIVTKLKIPEYTDKYPNSGNIY